MEADFNRMTNNADSVRLHGYALRPVDYSARVSCTIFIEGSRGKPIIWSQAN